ncbi:MAG TPA: hypothetical protein VFA34_10990 [Actinomycetota bacterium]|nr:hypothetical protein [Actinomycetota bacterium]
MAGSLIALALVAAWVLRPGPNLREGSDVVETGSVRIASRTPDAYRIVYRTESRAGGEVVVGTERLWVKRPFKARSESWTGAPPGRKRTSVTINAFARINVGNSAFAIPPGPAPQDRRIERSLGEITHAGYLERRELRRVTGRLCRVYRAGGEGGSGSLERLSDDKTYTDLCFDAAGLVLEEVAYSDGKLLNRSVAVTVDESPRVPDRLFRTGEPTLSARQGGGSVRAAEPASRPPGDFWELSNVPRGFRHEGRYAVIPPQSGFDDPTMRSGIIAFTSDVLVDGLDVVVVEQGSTLGGSPPFSADPNAKRVRAGALGRGELLYGLRTSEVRVLRKGGKFVRVVGTVEPSRLLAIARSLEKRRGGELIYLDG